MANIGKSITIKGEKRSQREEKGRTDFFSEREYGAFQRSFKLPTDADPKSVTADFNDGVLLIRISKSGPPPDTATSTRSPLANIPCSLMSRWIWWSIIRLAKLLTHGLAHLFGETLDFSES